jgi:glucose-1-phosphate thymidylyltransferase
VYVLAKGLVVVPSSTCWTGPWLGATRATALQRVANRPIVCHVLDALRDAGIVEAAVLAPDAVASEFAECIEREGPQGLAVRQLSYDDAAADGAALREAVEFVGDGSCILHRADGLLGQPILSVTGPERAPAPSALLMVHRDPRATRLRLVHSDALACEDGGPPDGVAGMCLLGPGVLSRLADRARTTPLIDFHTIAEHVVREGGELRVQTARRWRHAGGDALDLLDMNRMVLDTLSAEAMPDPDDGNRYEGHVVIHPTARVTSSIILGPTIVGAGAWISDSYIGPHTSIGERVRIEGAEVERSIVLADARILHVGGRLVASIIGRDAHIFRDFSMPRALRLQVSDGDQVALC